jgi:YidC/Oxa1 family membrane protein insertase
MDNLRLVLIFTLAFLGLLIYQAWQQDYGTTVQQSDEQIQETVVTSGQDEDEARIPTADKPAARLPSAEAPSTEGQPDSAKSRHADIIKVETDLLRLEISTQGGTVQKASLVNYPMSLDAPDVKVELFSPSKTKRYLAQSGLKGADGKEAPDHGTLYQADQLVYQMNEGVDELVIPIVWKSNDGVSITKQFVLKRGSYLIDVRYLIDNQSGESWSVRDYGQLLRVKPGDSGGSFADPTYTGGVYYTPKDKYEKIDFDEMAEASLNVESVQGWLAMIQHYFVTAWIPPNDQKEHYYSGSEQGGQLLLGSYSPSVTIPSGDTKTISRQLYAGPKLQDELEKITEGLELTVDYGFLTIIAKPIFYLLKWIHKLVGNWGWAIIILTLLIKVVFFKLSETSYKSMANLRKLAPRMQAIKDRYGDDKQRVQAAMMEFYKKEKINPMGGCLPILVQIPVFIALYWVLLESVELRQAPWILWINSLSEKDPYFILPLIMGVSMYVQQKLSPAPTADPMQIKIMMSLPFVFTIFFAFFPSGLVLYWVVNNIISITQQWYITRKIEQSGSH